MSALGWAGLGMEVGGELGIFDPIKEWLGRGARGRLREEGYEEQERLNKINEETAKRMADYNMMQQGQWFNQYQSPEAKMRQLKEAGLNPALIYGQSGAGGANSMGQGQAATPGTKDSASRYMAIESKMAMSQQAANLALLEAQRRNIDADTANKQQGTDTGKATERLLGEQLIGQSLDNYWKDDLSEAALGKMKSEIRKNNTEAGLNVQKVIESRENVKLTQEQTKKVTEEIELVVAKTLETEALKNLHWSQAAYYEKAVAEMTAHIALMEAQTGVLEQEERIKKIEANFVEKWKMPTNMAAALAIAVGNALGGATQAIVKILEAIRGKGPGGMKSAGAGKYAKPSGKF